jgi:dihydroxycyclohexadiene carboxylate dehydrogenase
MNQRYADKVVIITGSAQGIGARLAERVAAEGGLAVLADRAPLVHEVVANIQARGGHASAIEVDLETYAGAEQMVAHAVERHGRIDVLFNNVGGTIWTRPFEKYEPAHIEDEIRRSLFPTLWCTRAALPVMIGNGKGVIVNVSSIATRSIYRVPYAAAKGGVNALTASLAMEAASKGIRVVAVAVGGTEAPPRRIPRNPNGNPFDLSEQDQAWYREIIQQTTNSTYLGRYGTIDEMVAPLLFLGSDEASYITGSVLPAGGGDQG